MVSGLPLLLTAFLTQVIVPLARIATSYRGTQAGLSASELLLLSSAFALLPAFLAVGMGRANDRRGAGRSVVLGAALMVVACALLALPGQWLVLLTSSVLLGLGQTFQITAMQAEIGAIRDVPHRERMIARLMLWQAVGQVAAPLLLSLVALWGESLQIGLALAVIGLSGVGLAASMAVMRGAAKAAPPALHVPLAHILSVRGLPWVIAGGSLCVAVQDLTMIYLPVVGEGRGIPPATIGLVLMLFALAQVASRGVYAWAARLAGPSWLLWCSVLGTGLATAALALPFGAGGIGAMLIVSGLCLGFAITSSVSLTMRMAPCGARATSLGLRLAINRVGQFSIPLAAGAIAAAQAGAVFALLGLALAATGLAGFVRAR